MVNSESHRKNILVLSEVIFTAINQWDQQLN